MTEQIRLSQSQIAEFHHEAFVSDQVAHFASMFAGRLGANDVVVDIGGGAGYFCAQLRDKLQKQVRLIDLNPESVKLANDIGINAQVGDALDPSKDISDRVVCFNLILHHLVASSESETRKLQTNAISVWCDRNYYVFVNEYIYESYLYNLAPKLIYYITSSTLLSSIGRVVSKFIPSLKANTFGVGVRFRGDLEWQNLFEKTGFRIVEHLRGIPEDVTIPRKMLLIKSIRRDSYLLEKA